MRRFLILGAALGCLALFGGANVAKADWYGGYYSPYYGGYYYSSPYYYSTPYYYPSPYSYGYYGQPGFSITFGSPYGGYWGGRGYYGGRGYWDGRDWGGRGYRGGHHRGHRH
jgi:hypothetical protein